MLAQHRDTIGVWDTVAEDSRVCTLPGASPTRRRRDVATLLADGALTGLSIGFWPRDVDYLEAGPHAQGRRQHGRPVRPRRGAHHPADLVEVSIVAAPADDEARIDSVPRANY